MATTHVGSLYPGDQLVPNPNKSSENLLVSVSTQNYSPKNWWDLVAIGSFMYIIGGTLVPSSRVFVMDCRSHVWHETPSMHVARRLPSVSVLDGKIYVAKGIEDNYSSLNWIECFDPETKIWEPVPIPDIAYILKFCKLRSLVIKGNLYFLDRWATKITVYKPKENTWGGLEEMILDGTHDSFCVIDNVLYGYGSSKRLEWYDSEVRSWKVLEGVEELPILPNHCYPVLANYGGKLAILWEEKMYAIVSNKKKIWCVEISLERYNKHEIFGKVEWCEVVVTIPKSWFIKKCNDVIV